MNASNTRALARFIEETPVNRAIEQMLAFETPAVRFLRVNREAIAKLKLEADDA